MPIPDAFTYVAPNDDTAPRHKRIRDAEAACTTAVLNNICRIDLPAADRFPGISAACKRFHDELVAVCPPSADLSASLRCVRLARMAANEAVAVKDQFDRCVQIAAEQLLFARWQACASVALALPTELPPLDVAG